MVRIILAVLYIAICIKLIYLNRIEVIILVSVIFVIINSLYNDLQNKNRK